MKENLTYKWVQEEQEVECNSSGADTQLAFGHIYHSRDKFEKTGCLQLEPIDKESLDIVERIYRRKLCTTRKYEDEKIFDRTLFN